MAVPVKRGGAQHEQFSLPEEPEVGGDVAMVGGNDEGPNLDISPENEDWDLPEGAPKPPVRRERGGEVEHEEPEQATEDARLAYDDTGEAEPEERQSRRARRNARRREYMDQQAQYIQALNQKLEALGGVVNQLTRGQAGLAVNTIDGQITSLQQALRMADQELADAVKTANGDKYAEVNALRDEVVGRLWQAKNHRERMAQGGQTFQQPPQQQNGPPQSQADPALVEAVQDKFDRFQDRFPWFDSQSADADCNIVRAIDGELVAQGYQRHTPVFWQMLEQKMARYGLKPGEREEGDEDDLDEPPRRRANGGRSPLGRDVQVPVRRGGPPTGSGRSTRPAAGGYSLSEWQRDALRDEGLLEENLDEASVAKRDRIIGKWRKGADTLRRRGMN